MVILGTTLLLSACTDPVAEELNDYHNEEWLPFNEMLLEFDEITNGFDQLVAMNNLQGIEVYLEDELFPTMDEMIEYLDDIDLEHEEVQELHQLQMNAFEKMQTSFQTVYESLQLEMEGRNAEAMDLADQFNAEVEESENMQEDFHEHREELWDEYNIELVDEEEEI